MYRTTLTGWLLLVGNPIRIVRLLIALFLSVGYLVALLECQPYKRKSDSVLASWAQVLLICIFGNGILVRCYPKFRIKSALIGIKLLLHSFPATRRFKRIQAFQVIQLARLN